MHRALQSLLFTYLALNNPSSSLPIHLPLAVDHGNPKIRSMTLPPPSLPTPAKLASSFLSSSSPPSLLLLFSAALSFLIFLKTPRRFFLRRPVPPLSMPPPPSPFPLLFPSPESLSHYLLPLLPPGSLSSWGSSPGSKTLSNLWLELSNGESSLLPSTPLIRSVHVATVNIRNPRGLLLLESHQILSDGTVRERGRPLSEKMRPGETAEDAAIRAVEEELGVAGSGGSVAILPGSYAVRVEERASGSYPGLRARYVLHSVEARVEGLPEEGEFWTEERGEGGEEEMGIGAAVFVRKHFWKWVDDCEGDGGPR